MRREVTKADFAKMKANIKKNRDFIMSDEKVVRTLEILSKE
ncbi:hypothetical protein LD125_00669 [Mesoplasma sp. JKS002658]|nr:MULTISPECIES: hypothetical protein [unclassified Mesoplasma]MCL8211611.1 hypothetical protein [Mesoplasma sp. JKS002664]MCL8212350.1 hypothetical protein [Mesoplasma sp. JKS002662]MCL8213498.1 hypothetical protein [Mesoplasma sp. JKS002660]MCL8214405.1 hypothetical protein [Mesoplasma sp. JKS002658]MCL8214986.1 hypothetical protein [Mesoplasma sp. JKS002663]